jgi:hypothetical protein
MPDPQTPPWVQAILAEADAVKAGQTTPAPALAPPRQSAQPTLSPGAAYLAAQPIEPPLAVSHAQVPVSHIGAPVVGERYVPPSLSLSSLMTSANPAQDVAEHVLGPGRPRAVRAADPYGDVAWMKGAGPPPGFIVGSTEAVGGPVEAAALGDLRPAALRELGPATWRRGTPGRYSNTVLSGRDAEHVMQAIDNVTKRFPSLKAALPELEQALQSEPPSRGRWADSIYRDPDTGLILPTPDAIGRWARYGLYGEEIPANWGPLTQPGVREGFGPDPREIKLYSDLWGAISPLNDPMVNTLQANRAYARTLGPSGFSPMEQPEFARLGLGLPSRRPNINRSMAGEPLSGPKVPRMSGMLQGTESLPPLDEHVTTASGGATGKWSEELPALRAKMRELTGDPFTGPAGELRLNKQLSEGLVEMWRAMYPERPPLTSMAASWEGIRSDKGIKSVGGPYDILRRLGLHEKNAMLDPDRVRGAKWPGGYISSSALLPLLLHHWNAATAGQPEDADPTGPPPPR